MLSTTKLLALLLAACSAQVLALPIPRPRPDAPAQAACSKNGALICSADGTQFSMCNFGKAVPMGPVAAGTTCQNGEMVALSNHSQQPQPSPTIRPTTSASMPSVAPEPTMAPEPTNSVAPSEPVGSNEPEPDAITSTITSIQKLKITSTSTLMVTLTGEPPAESTVPSLTMATSAAAEPTSRSTSFDITSDLILKIAPKSSSCANLVATGECSTADVAAEQIAAALAKYQINTIGEAAAVISIMAFESVDFEFNSNQSPGRPGQGTKAMLMPNFVFQYAQSLKLDPESIAPGATPDTINNQSPDVLNKILALVQPDKFTFGSAPWFYTANCSDDIKAGLKASPVTIAAWSAYISNCVHTSVTPERQSGFVTAVLALGGTTPS
ncbi:hypothetical protein AA313_de0202627 [Arthrobotrys entomopaga]|nr:hypothetical protein AA313_de0202627 [Arthrobotrys entomopaga]